jgi:hypothetical protein
MTDQRGLQLTSQRQLRIDALAPTLLSPFVITLKPIYRWAEAVSCGF